MSNLHSKEIGLQILNSIMSNSILVDQNGDRFNPLCKDILENSALVIAAYDNRIRLYRVNTKNKTRTHEFIFTKNTFILETDNSKQVIVHVQLTDASDILEALHQMVNGLVYSRVIRGFNDYAIDETSLVSYENLASLFNKLHLKS